ncbi:MAG: helix-turn-helix transcriptional regulator [Gammaproteobacteria bacterium]
MGNFLRDSHFLRLKFLHALFKSADDRLAFGFNDPVYAPLRSPTAQEAFGNLLRQVRVHVGSSQEQLAARSGITLSPIMRLESGITEPTLSELFALSRAVNARLGSIIEGVEFLMGLDSKSRREPGYDEKALEL